ncbi:MAG TPA: efflux RND transporter periplasmic adaptor subunit [Usitatibacter sp.]|nr:efflux RND transporter periplasmic adaptor subunit [Usitatibacter sp.]
MIELDASHLGHMLVFAFCAAMAGGCKSEAKPPSPPPPEVLVIEVRPGPATVYNEYVAQTEAPDTIEIRSQVTGLLARQAFSDGARVKKGDLLYVIDTRPFEAQRAQAQASVTQAEANLANARLNLARHGRLIAENAVSRQDYDNALAQEQSSAAVVEAQKAMLRTAELNLEFATLRAPRDGYMSSSQVKPGTLITAQQTLLSTLYSNDPMWVTFTISEDRLLQVQKARRRPDSSTPFRIRLADGSDYALTGRLDFIDSAIDRKSGTLQVRIAVANPDRVLRPGLFVRVIVPALDSPDAIRVPQQAVRELQGTKSVFVVGADNKAESRSIVATHRLENDWVVASGLTAGERVVVEGTGKIRPGQSVKPIAPAIPTAAKS